jgi:hypothetical protein
MNDKEKEPQNNCRNGDWFCATCDNRLQFGATAQKPNDPEGYLYCRECFTPAPMFYKTTIYIK